MLAELQKGEKVYPARLWYQEGYTIAQLSRVSPTWKVDVQTGLTIPWPWNSSQSLVLSGSNDMEFRLVLAQVSIGVTRFDESLVEARSVSGIYTSSHQATFQLAEIGWKKGRGQPQEVPLKSGFLSVTAGGHATLFGSQYERIRVIEDVPANGGDCW